MNFKFFETEQSSIRYEELIDQPKNCYYLLKKLPIYEVR